MHTPLPILLITLRSHPANSLLVWKLSSPALTVLKQKGSGKSTLARALEKERGWARLSIDKAVFEAHGTYAVDYTPAEYEVFQTDAEVSLQAQLREILKEGKSDVVLDLSFWSKEMRDEYRSLVEKEGGERYGIVLVVFRVPGSFEKVERVLSGRLEKRKEERRTRDVELRSSRGGDSCGRDVREREQRKKRVEVKEDWRVWILILGC